MSIAGVDTDRIKTLVDAAQSRFEAQFGAVEIVPQMAAVPCNTPMPPDAVAYPYIVVCFPPRGSDGSQSPDEVIAGWESAAATLFDGDKAAKKLLWRIPLEVEVVPDVAANKTYFRAYGRAVAIPLSVAVTIAS